MGESEGSKRAAGSISLLWFFAVSVLFDLLSVPMHEAGHALVYAAQGQRVVFHFTRADPADGSISPAGAAGGLAVNLACAALALALFWRRKKILWYAAVAAHTLFSRILVYSIFIPLGGAPSDESYLGAALSLKPVFVAIFGLALMLGFFAAATCLLFRRIKGRRAWLILAMSLGAALLSLCIVLPLDAKGI